MKKKIGVSFTKTNFHYYIDWFSAEDLKDDIELVVLSYEQGNTEDINTCDGFVLTGGVDVHPSFYNGATDYANAPADFELERDVFEKKIFDHAQLYQLPLLGICRGMQVVNVLSGGLLTQDLAEANATHRKEDGVDKLHLVNLEKDSLLSEIVGNEKGDVNSAHHQALHQEKIGEALMINAVSDDGVIEGIEYKDKRGKGFMLCVQWHPERMTDRDSNPLSYKIKERFLEEVRAVDAPKLTIINPATEEIITAIIEDTQDSVTAKFERLQNGQKAWQQLALGERISILRKFSELLQQHIELLAFTLTSEVGKPLQQSRNEINGGCTRIAWLLKNAGNYLSNELMTDEEGLKEEIVHEPLGIVGNISAWNYPYLVGINVFIPALVAGNAVFYKPSEYATLTGLQIEKLLKKAGVPEDVFQIAIGKGNVGEYLLHLPLHGYFFTGSYKTGKYIYERVASKMVPCQCELGGKDPLYVMNDITDVKAVAAATADGAFYNNGQSCCAVERIYIHADVYDAYIDEFKKEVQSYKLGSPNNEGVYIGAISRREQLQVLLQQVDDAVDKGAIVLTGGNIVTRSGFYFEPTVLVNVNHTMSIMRDESFGPVIGIMKVEDDEEAIKLMQDTEYGLTASVYSNSKERADSVFKKLNTGTVYWNCCDRISAALPWSGRKHSGFGTTLSGAGIRAFTKPKAYHLKGN